MVSLHPEYLIDKDKHTKAVVLPFPEWEAVLAELDDIRAYDTAKASSAERIPLDQAVREIQEGYEG